MGTGLWSSLVVDLLSMIDEHNEQLVDKIRLRCVCKHWQSLRPVSLDLRQPQLPCLLLPYANGSSACGLYHPFQNKIFEIDLPEAGEKVFKGSGHGWVVTVQEDGSISVFNPLSRVQFPLPPRSEFPDVINYRTDKNGNTYIFKWYAEASEESALYVRNYRTTKIALSSSPNSSDFRAVAIYGANSNLAYCKIGDKKWRSIEINTDRNEFEDVTFFDGKLYALQVEGDLMVCDDIVSCPKLRKYVPLPQGIGVTSDVSLVNAPDCLMAVVRHPKCSKVQVTPIDDEDDSDYGFTFKTRWFKVFKLDMSSLSWVHMESLGSRVLFMGLAAQWCIDPPDYEDIKNRIYFSSHLLQFEVQEIQDCFDIGIYHVEEKTFKPLGYECNNPQITWPSPVWVTLNPY